MGWRKLVLAPVDPAQAVSCPLRACRLGPSLGCAQTSLSLEGRQRRFDEYPLCSPHLPVSMLEPPGWDARQTGPGNPVSGNLGALTPRRRHGKLVFCRGCGVSATV